MKSLSLTLGAIAVLVSGCMAETSKPETASTSQSLAVVGMNPVPCEFKEGEDAGEGEWEVVWDSGQPLLAFADAMASCGWFDEHYSTWGGAALWFELQLLGQGEGDSIGTHDPVAQTVASKMSSSFGNASWITNRRRNDQAGMFGGAEPADGRRLSNCVPFGDKSSANRRSVLVPKSAPKQSIFPGAVPPNIGIAPTSFVASRQLRLPAMSLCIAEHLRSAVPGAAGAEALLLSGKEQRELLELARERAQLSILQHATLASIFAGDAQNRDDSVYTHTLPILQEWAASTAAEPHLEKMATDFGQAVQLYSTISEELASLYARSSSAELERGGDIASVADERWGEGSWLQRFGSLMYGGDPLAVSKDSPWEHLLGATFTGPGRSRFPYADVAAHGPQVESFLSLIRLYDVMDIPYLWCGSLGQNPALGKDWYRAVETVYRRDRCRDGEDTNGDCIVVDLTTATNFDEFALLADRGISVDHAVSAAELVRALFGGVVDIANCGEPAMFAGSHRVAGRVTTTQDGWYGLMHIDPSVRFMPRSGRDRAAVFTDAGSIRVGAQTDVARTKSAGRLGFKPWRQRKVGVISTLSATRLALAQALEKRPGLANLFLQHADRVGDVIASHAGTSISLTPPLDAAGTIFLSHTPVVPIYQPSDWTFRVAPVADDEFWQAGDEDWEVFIVPDDSFAGDLAVAPASAIGSRSFARMVDENPGRVLGAATGVAIPFMQARVPSPANGEESTIFVWKRTSQQRDDLAHALIACDQGTGEFCPPAPAGDVRLIAASLRLDGDSIEEGRYFGGHTGWFSRLLERHLTEDALSPSETAYDGLGLPNRWVPPLNAELVGGTPGSHTFTHYLAAAKSAAAEATIQARSALEGLIDQEFDESTQQAAETNALAELASTQKALCGRDNPGCTVEFTRGAYVTNALVPALDEFTPRAGLDMAACAAIFPLSWPDHPWIIHVDRDELRTDARENITNDIKRTRELLDCFVLAVRQRLGRTSFTLADVVSDELIMNQLDETLSVPSFEQFAGGELQDAFILQWSAIAAEHEALRALYVLVEAANSSLDAVAAQFEVADHATEKASCTFWEVAGDVGMSLLPIGGELATKEGAARYESKGESGMSGWNWVGAAFGAVAQVVSTMNSAHLDCTAAESNLKATTKAVLAQGRNSMANVLGRGAFLLAANVQVVRTGAEIERLNAQTAVAKDKWELEMELASADKVTSYGLARRYRAYDLWRAKALLDNARRYALAARRGIEAYYAVDLTKLSADEPFVAAPSEWINEIYEYDLSLPAALGISVTTGQEQEGGIYADKVGDYIRNLESVVRGWAVERPTAIVDEDIETISLPGLAPAYDLDEQSGELVKRVSSAEWVLKCPLEDGSAEWTPVSPAGADDTCAFGRPVSARTDFMLDPWGQLDMPIAPDAFANRFNARWTRLAVNLVGAGLIDCRDARDRYTCEQERYRSFNLRHTGMPWITDYDGLWSVLRVGTGVIEGGKAIADERFLNPIEHGWNTPYISTVARTEFHWRPLSGRYELELEVGPHMNLDRLERVQLLVGTSYWTRP